MSNESEQSNETGSDKTKNRNTKKVPIPVKIGAAVTALVAAGSLAYAFKGDSDNSEAKPRPAPTTAEAPETTTSTTPDRVLSKELREKIEKINIVGSPQQKNYMRKVAEHLALLKDQKYINDLFRYNADIIMVDVGYGVFPTLNDERFTNGETRFLTTKDGVVHPNYNFFDQRPMTNDDRKEELDNSAIQWDHENYQGLRYMEYQQSHPGESVPDSVWSGKEVEHAALRRSLKLADELGASERIIQNLKDSFQIPYWEWPLEARK